MLVVGLKFENSISLQVYLYVIVVDCFKIHIEICVGIPSKRPKYMGRYKHKTIKCMKTLHGGGGMRGYQGYERDGAGLLKYNIMSSIIVRKKKITVH